MSTTYRAPSTRAMKSGADGYCTGCLGTMLAEPQTDAIGTPVTACASCRRTHPDYIGAYTWQAPGCDPDCLAPCCSPGRADR